MISLMIDKLPLFDEIKKHVSSFIGLESVQDMFGPCPYICKK